uniref:Uncharacterized protein n=1 Tax=Pipistrellus kuhlii TaxID=59472 RepID=A0A7J7YMM2_PIPKU|nr:hypothetical protein mPipKuh1_010151 [Pipistrellus kuhlii]
MSVTMYMSVREYKVSRHVCIGMCMCLYIYSPVYASVCVYGVCASTHLRVFLVDAQHKAKKESSPLLSPHLLLHLETQRAIARSQLASSSHSCFSLQDSAASSCHPLLRLSAPGWPLPSTSPCFPTRAEGWLWDWHVTWAGPLRHFAQVFAAGTSREECLRPLG